MLVRVWRESLTEAPYRRRKGHVLLLFALALAANLDKHQLDRSYLVDPASSHMLVSKIKPCMSKYSPRTVKLRMAH